MTRINIKSLLCFALRQWFFALSLLFSFPLLAQEIEAVATVSKNVVTLDEIFQLNIQVNDEVKNTNIDLSALEADFVYGQPSLSRSLSNLNGKVNKSTVWRVSLQAKNRGTFRIPSLNISGLSTDPINIQVVPSSAVSAQENKDIQLNAKINENSAYIGESLIYTVQLSVATRIESASLSAPQGDGFQVTPLGNDIHAENIINGRRYDSITRQYRITPTKAGDINLSGAVFSANELRGSGFNSLAIPVKLSTEEIKLQIKDKPEGFNGVWLPTPDLQISQQWQFNNKDQQEIRVGDAINRIIELKIKNITPSAMPNISIAYPDSLSVYDETPQYDQEDGYSIMRLKQVIIPRQAGSIDLPALKINWFNTIKEQEQVTEIKGKNISIIANENNALNEQLLAANPVNTGSITELDSKGVSSFWPWLTAIFATLWMLTLALFFHQRKSILMPKVTKERQDSSFTALKEAVKSKNIAKISTLYQRLDLYHLPNALSKAIETEMNTMLAAHYSASPSQWENKNLLSLIKKAQKQKPIRKKAPALAEF